MGSTWVTHLDIDLSARSIMTLSIDSGTGRNKSGELSLVDALGKENILIIVNNAKPC